jgi:hypothetical protein
LPLCGFCKHPTGGFSPRGRDKRRDNNTPIRDGK